MRTCLLLFTCLFLLATVSWGQDLSMYRKHWYVHNNDTMPYRLLLPKSYDKNRKYPLIVFLHGSGERGRDNEAQLVHGAALFLRDSIRDRYPAIVVFPQCAQNSYWSNVVIKMDSVTGQRSFHFGDEGAPSKAMKLLMKLLVQLEDTYHPDRKHIYVGGLSMGGMGTFELVRRKPKYFAAAFSICGGADPATAPKLVHTRWWIFHGLKDNVVDPRFSKEMAAALKAAGADVRLTLYPEANHNSWDSAFAEKDLMPWLFSKGKSGNVKIGK